MFLVYFSTTKDLKDCKFTSSKSELGNLSHRVALVKYDKLDTFAHELLSGAKTFDLLSDDVDTSIV